MAEFPAYKVRVEENAHTRDGASGWLLGEYTEPDIALSAAKRVIDEDLALFHQPGMTAEDLYRLYTLFGHDAYILTDDPDSQFSGWDYARQRCRELTRAV